MKQLLPIFNHWNIFDTPTEQNRIFQNLDIELGITDENDYLNSDFIRTPSGGRVFNFTLWKRNCLDVMDALVKLGERTEQEREEYKQQIDEIIQTEIEQNCELWFHLNKKNENKTSECHDGFSNCTLTNDKKPRGIGEGQDTYQRHSLTFQGLIYE